MDQAAADYAAHTLYAAGNGSLMRCAASAGHFASAGRQATMDLARRISVLTHRDPAAGEGCALLHDLVRIVLTDGDPVTAVPDALTHVSQEHRERWAVVLAPDWHPDWATESNGAVWPTPCSAVWALRTTATFTDALRAAIDLGGYTRHGRRRHRHPCRSRVRTRKCPGGLADGAACASAGLGWPAPYG